MEFDILVCQCQIDKFATLESFHRHVTPQLLIFRAFLYLPDSNFFVVRHMYIESFLFLSNVESKYCLKYVAHVFCNNLTALDMWYLFEFALYGTKILPVYFDVDTRVVNTDVDFVQIDSIYIVEGEELERFCC